MGFGPTSVSDVKFENSQKYNNAHFVFKFKKDEVLVADLSTGKPLDTQLVDILNNHFKANKIYGNELEISTKIVDYKNISAFTGSGYIKIKVEISTAQKQKIGEFLLTTELIEAAGVEGALFLSASKIENKIKENFIK